MGHTRQTSDVGIKGDRAAADHIHSGVFRIAGIEIGGRADERADGQLTGIVIQFFDATTTGLVLAARKLDTDADIVGIAGAGIIDLTGNGTDMDGQHGSCVNVRARDGDAAVLHPQIDDVNGGVVV